LANADQLLTTCTWNTLRSLPGSRYNIVDVARAADPRPTSVNDLFWRNEITLTSSYGGSPADYARALGLIQAGKIRVRDMITHRLGLAETGLGFQLVARAQDSLKVVIEPQR
jgi:L-iditol 2-dehydrogenase